MKNNLLQDREAGYEENKWIFCSRCCQNSTYFFLPFASSVPMSPTPQCQHSISGPGAHQRTLCLHAAKTRKVREWRPPWSSPSPLTDSNWWINTPNPCHVEWDDSEAHSLHCHPEHPSRAELQVSTVVTGSSPSQSHLHTPLPVFPGTVSHVNYFTPITVRDSVLNNPNQEFCP